MGLSDAELEVIMNQSQVNMLTEEFYKTLLDCLFDAVYTVDAQGIITYWNDSCTRITGYPAEEMLSQHWRQTPFANRTEEQGPDIPQRHGIEIVLETGMPGTWKGYVQRKNGQRIPIESHISAIRNPQGQIIGATEIFRDVSAHVALEDAHRQLLQLSRKDQLTGLFNRTAISDVIKAEVERSQRYQQPLSVVMVDIDRFKRVNDCYGHDAGDKVLAKISSILMCNLRQPDVVGRWGGEEFLVIAPGCDHIAGAQLAERLRRFIEEVPVGDFPEPITASFGVAQLQKAQGPDQLLFAADMALYEAKNSGRNRVVVASADKSTRKFNSPPEIDS
jgi:diguanylate cyclase (GGDEF)-like protein/PAS domain S-box-containing protein